MVPNESNPLKETQTKEAATRRVKKTRGMVGGFNRGVWNYMKKEIKLSETEILNMKQATCPAKFNSMAATLIRYFNPDVAKENGVTIEDYESLNEHPELILYEGYYISGKGGEITIKKWEGVGTSLVEEKIKKGAITEVGVVIEKTAAQKMLSGCGHFMLMGGFLLVLILGLVIAIAISALVKGC
jgi:hypothetical protein